MVVIFLNTLFEFKFLLGEKQTQTRAYYPIVVKEEEEIVNEILEQ